MKSFTVPINYISTRNVNTNVRVNRKDTLAPVTSELSTVVGESAGHTNLVSM